MLKRTISVAAVCAVVLAGAMAPALAKRPAHAGGGHGQGKGHGKSRPAATQMMFKLDENEVAPGSDVTGTVLLRSAKGKNKTPIGGATLTVTVDGIDAGTLTTDAEGAAALTITAPAEGEHEVRVSYAGDTTYRKAQRTQGFFVGILEDDEGEGGAEVVETI